MSSKLFKKVVLYCPLSGLSTDQVNYMTKKYKLGEINQENLLEVLKFFNENNFTKEEVLASPTVLKIHPVTLEHRYLLLQESGFVRISPQIISKYKSDLFVCLLS